jgi:hypothetical protein
MTTKTPEEIAAEAAAKQAAEAAKTAEAEPAKVAKKPAKVDADLLPPDGPSKHYAG